jgi:protein-disulfide isomerase
MPYIGEPDAPAVLTEFGDFACPHCYEFSLQAHQLIDTYVADGSLKIVYKLVSFVNPQTSPTAAAAGLCAAQQGKFWEMHDALFGLLNTRGSAAFTRSNVSDLAADLGLDEGEFGDCLTSGQTRQTVQSVLAEAQRLGITGTPTLLFNGELITQDQVPYTFEGIESLIRLSLM